MKHVLVIGGAGYIGSHMCKCLARNGYIPLVLDNLVTGHREAVKWGKLFVGSMSDKELLKRIFSDYEIVCVMHFAAYCYVGESVTQPLKYYQNNVRHYFARCANCFSSFRITRIFTQYYTKKT